MSENTESQESDDSLETKECKEFIQALLSLAEQVNIESFFFHALETYYETPEFREDYNKSRFKVYAGHLLYRLSDYIPMEHREKIRVCLDIDCIGKLIINGANWLSLEDWRVEWERNRPIPFFQRQLLSELVRKIEDLR
jgi:hypothetical protein